MSKIKNLYIIGAGGFGREVAWLVERINLIQPTWNLKGFIDDNVVIQGNVLNGYKIVGGCDYLQNLNEDVWVVCAIGSSRVRKKIIEKIEDYKHIRFATLIDPDARYSELVKFGEGTIICADTIITVNVSIGNHVIVNLDCTIGHDVVMHDFVTLYPSVNISGNVTIGECTELGTGMQIIQGKVIRSNTIIGAGAVVVRNIDEMGTYVGIPATRVNKEQKIVVFEGQVPQNAKASLEVGM
jgi:sugar O-acyltransferase (sialic acid O-acetyltransferase NeuD family)